MKKVLLVLQEDPKALKNEKIEDLKTGIIITSIRYRNTVLILLILFQYTKAWKILEKEPSPARIGFDTAKNEPQKEPVLGFFLAEPSRAEYSVNKTGSRLVHSPDLFVGRIVQEPEPE